MSKLLLIRSSVTLQTIVLSLCFTVAFSQKKNPTQTIDPAYVSIADGVASPFVFSVIQDSFGLIWIATSNGLQKYDGYRFETFKNAPGKPTTLQESNARSVMEDSEHNIWVGTGLGISRYDRRKNEFKNYRFPGYFNTANDAPYGVTLAIIEDSQKNLWGATRFLGLVHYNKVIDNWEFAKYYVPGNPAPDNYTLCFGFAEDAKGGLWVGNNLHGLMHRANGDSVFRQVQNEQLLKLIEPNAITALFFDQEQAMWITTTDGVHKYYPETNTLKTIITYTEGNGDAASYLNQICQDKEGNVWIANNFRGILKFNGISDNYTEIELVGKLKMRTHGWNITITKFMIDKSGIFWFGTREAGLIKYDPVNKPFQHLSHNPADPNSLSSGGVFGILASNVKPGTVYVGTRGSGINVYDPQKQTFDKVKFKVVGDMFGGSARGMTEEPDGSLWLGTWGDGLIKLDKDYNEVKRYKYDAKNKNSISNNQVRVVKRSGDGRLWVGTVNGLNIINPNTNTVARIESSSTQQLPDGLVAEMDKLIASEQKVGSIERVPDIQNITVPIEIKTASTYWVMVVGEGDPTVGWVDYGWIENPAHDTVWRMTTFKKSFYAGGAPKNRIVVGSVELKPGTYNLRYKTDDSHAFGKWNEAPPNQSTLYGIALIQPKSSDELQSFQRPVNPERQDILLSGVDINDIEVTDKYVWVTSAGGGLDRVDPETNQVKHYENDPTNSNSLSNNNIREITVDSHGMIWLATNEGINKFDPNTETFTQYYETDGLPTNFTEGIVEGDDGEMWIATQNGLSQMVRNDNLNKVTFINYNSTDGLGGDTFLSLADTRATDGRFYFGGDHGLSTFSSITSNKTAPAIVISNLFISNKPIAELTSSPLTKSLIETKSLTLPFNQNNLSFEFAALHYANPKKNQYAHMLKGYDQDWIYDNRNFAAYTNLYPGTYQFMIRAANAYGVWNEQGLTFEIKILPPWWRTWWAYTSYVLIFGAFAFTTDRTVRRGIKLREQARSRERELEQAKEIEKAYKELKATQSQLIQSEKMASLGELTAGIAHEIQNPLNFVNNFSDVNTELIRELREELAVGNKQSAEEIINNIESNSEKINYHGKRAGDIVRSMLQHSRKSTGQKELTDINALCDEYLRLSYHGLRAKDKTFNAKFETDFDPVLPKINVIPQDLGRVVLNLINNAFYAVNEKAKLQASASGFQPQVTIITKNLGNKIEVIVKDNGSGISDAIKEKIFQPFFTTKPTGFGTGLGLSLSYDIITNGHGGEIKIETNENAGATFIITLPNK